MLYTLDKAMIKSLEVYIEAPKRLLSRNSYFCVYNERDGTMSAVEV